MIALSFYERIGNGAKFVIDANVVIKWILPEIYSDRVFSLLDNDEDELLVPDFFYHLTPTGAAGFVRREPI